jgi:ribosome-associated translation inhibitor RaiA
MNDAESTGPEVRHKLQVYFDTHECEIAKDVIGGLTDDVDSLARQVGNFPQADLRVVIGWNGRNNEYTLKLTLILPGDTLVTSDHDVVLHAAFERALSSLEKAVARYKDRLDQAAERHKHEVGTVQEVTPGTPVDLAAIDAAAAAMDYVAYRSAVAPYEDSLRVRVGRWVERYPAMQARLGNGLNVNQLVDGVFLTALEGHDRRPKEARYGEWLETLIAPTIRAIEHDPAGELENINMARSAVG